MDTHYNPEEWYTTLPLLPGVSKTTELGNNLIENWDNEQLDIAKQLIKRTEEWSSFEEIKNHLGKKAKPISLVFDRCAWKITNTVWQAHSITVDSQPRRKFQKIRNRRRLETRNKRY